MEAYPFIHQSVSFVKYETSIFWQQLFFHLLWLVSTSLLYFFHLLKFFDCTQKTEVSIDSPIFSAVFAKIFPCFLIYVCMMRL